MGGGAATTQTQTADTFDRRITGGENSQITALQDSEITLSPGASVNFTSADPEVIRAVLELGGDLGANAFDAATDLGNRTLSAARDLASGSLDTANSLAQGSNEIAAQVAKAQQEFVKVASGQGSLVYIVIAGVVVVAAVGGAIIYLTRKKA